MVASTGRPLLEADGVSAYRDRLLPHALIVTPNLWEAAMLAGTETLTGGHRSHGRASPAASMHWGRAGCWSRVATCPESRVGTIPPRPTVDDVLFDGTDVVTLTGSWVETPNTHGTGCSLSAALAANLAIGRSVADAVEIAKQFVHQALVGSREWRLGAGHGPIDQLGWSATS